MQGKKVTGFKVFKWWYRRKYKKLLVEFKDTQEAIKFAVDDDHEFHLQKELNLLAYHMSKLLDKI